MIPLWASAYPRLKRLCPMTLLFFSAFAIYTGGATSELQNASAKLFQRDVGRVAVGESVRKLIGEKTVHALEKILEHEDVEKRFCYAKDNPNRKYGNESGEMFLSRTETYGANESTTSTKKIRIQECDIIDHEETTLKEERFEAASIPRFPIDAGDSCRTGECYLAIGGGRRGSSPKKGQNTQKKTQNSQKKENDAAARERNALNQGQKALKEGMDGVVRASDALKQGTSGGTGPAVQPPAGAAARQQASNADAHSASTPNYFQDYFGSAFKYNYSISDRASASDALGYYVPCILNYGKSCSYVTTLELLAPAAKHIKPMITRRIKEGRGEATEKADALAQAVNEAFTDPGTEPMPISVEHFRLALHPDMSDKNVPGSLLRNLRTLFGDDGLKLKADDAARMGVHIERVAVCPICGKHFLQPGPSPIEDLYYYSLPGGKYNTAWAEQLGRPYSDFAANAKPSREGKIYLPCCKQEISYGPGKQYERIEYKDKIGLPATSMRASDRPTAEKPRLLLTVFSMKDEVEAKKLKVTLRASEDFHGLRLKVHPSLKRPDYMFDIDGQLVYRLLSYVILDDLKQGHGAVRMRNEANDRFFHIDSTDQEQFVVEINKDDFYGVDLKIPVALYQSVGQKSDKVPKSHEASWPAEERHRAETPLVKTSAVQTRARSNNRQRRHRGHAVSAMSSCSGVFGLGSLACVATPVTSLKVDVDSGNGTVTLSWIPSLAANHMFSYRLTYGSLNNSSGCAANHYSVLYVSKTSKNASIVLHNASSSCQYEVELTTVDLFMREASARARFAFEPQVNMTAASAMSLDKFERWWIIVALLCVFIACVVVCLGLFWQKLIKKFVGLSSKNLPPPVAV